MTTTFAALASILLSVAAQFLLKAGIAGVSRPDRGGEGAVMDLLFGAVREPLVVCGFLVYGLGALTWLIVLSKWDVSKAYPLVGLGFALTAFVGFFLGESVSFWRGLGIALIAAGVLLVGKT